MYLQFCWNMFASDSNVTNELRKTQKLNESNFSMWKYRIRHFKKREYWSYYVCTYSWNTC